MYFLIISSSNISNLEPNRTYRGGFSSIVQTQTSMDLIGIKKHSVDLLGPSLNLVEGLVCMRE